MNYDQANEMVHAINLIAFGVCVIAAICALHLFTGGNDK